MAAPGQARADTVTAVPIDAAGIDLRQQGLGARRIRGIDAGVQTIPCVIHQLHGLGIAADLLDADHRPKALFAHQVHAVIDIRKHGRLKPVARAAKGTGAAAPARMQPGTLGQCVGGLGFQHLQLGRAGDGAKVGVIKGRIAEFESFDSSHKSADEGIVDRLVHIDALDRAAALTGVVHRAVRQRLGRLLNRRVVANIGRVLATELKLQFHQTRCQCLGNPHARRVGAGEEQAVDGLLQQRSTHIASAHQRDHHVAGHTGLVQQPDDLQTGQRSKL